MPLMALNASGSDKTKRARLVSLSRTPRAVSDLDQPGQQGYPLLLRFNLGLPPGERRETHQGRERNVPWAAILFQRHLHCSFWWRPSFLPPSREIWRPSR